MITKHILKLTLVNGTWVIELRNSQIISGTKNLAESINMAGQFCWPQPELSCTLDLSKTELLKAA